MIGGVSISTTLKNQNERSRCVMKLFKFSFRKLNLNMDSKKIKNALKEARNYIKNKEFKEAHNQCKVRE